jgi:hypothetical protein
MKRWMPADQLLALVDRAEEAEWSRLRHGHRVATFARLEAERRGMPEQPCSWQATEPPAPRRPWAGLRDPEVALEAARVVADLGLRPGCRALGIDPRTASIAWRRHGISRPEIGRGRYSTVKG